ncbi:MAG: 30S ribosomal protein S18 [Phycisphaerales bacterium]|nr:30S ribosomal protein S18 [Phycisphaerales bacterium]
MSQFSPFGGQKPRFVQTSKNGTPFVDYKDHETLRRMLSPNGKIYGRKRLSTSAREQRMVTQAIKRARFMGLLPYTNATL